MLRKYAKRLFPVYSDKRNINATNSKGSNCDAFMGDVFVRGNVQKKVDDDDATTYGALYFFLLMETFPSCMIFIYAAPISIYKCETDSSQVTTW